MRKVIRQNYLMHNIYIPIPIYDVLFFYTKNIVYFRVRELNLQEIMEIFQAREAIEGMAAFLASNLTNDDFFE